MAASTGAANSTASAGTNREFVVGDFVASAAAAGSELGLAVLLPAVTLETTSLSYTC